MRKQSAKEIRYVLLGYVPIFGWFFPLFFGPQSTFVVFHAKQAFVLSACLFLSVLCYQIFLFVLPPFFTIVLHIAMLSVLVLVFYCIAHVLYAVFKQQKRLIIPVIGEIAERLRV